MAIKVVYFGVLKGPGIFMEKDKIGIKEIFNYIFSRYKIQVILLVALGFFGAALEGVGISAIIPALSFLLGGEGQATGGAVSEAIRSFFDFFSIPFTFRYLVAMIAGLFIFRAVVLSIFTYIRARIGAEFINSEMEDVLSATLRASWPFLLKQKIGYVQNTIVWDVRRSANLLDVFTQVIQSFTGFFIYLIIALNISVKITLVTLVAGVFLLFILKPLVKKTQAINQETSLVDKQLAQYLTEHIGGLKVVKASGEEHHVLKEAKKHLLLLRDLYTRNIVVHAFGTVFIQPFSIIFIIGVFASVYNTPGFSLAAFAATLYLIGKIFTYLQSGQGALHSVGELVPYVTNVITFKKNLSDNVEIKSKDHRHFKFNNSIDFTDVKFSYDATSRTILQGVDFVIKKGEMIGLIGPSGAGKTSIADLLLRLFRPWSGQITLDGVNIQDLDIGDWRSHIGYVSQDVFLTNETIFRNIKFYNNALSQEDVERAAKQAHIYDFIVSLPEGFSTVVGDRGIMLSVGQRQRIALARALVRKPDILILDEATSALDNESELLIQEAINELHGKVTVLIIAHRLSTIMNADRLLVLDAGKIVEEGSPHNLLQNKNSYFYKVHKIK